MICYKDMTFCPFWAECLEMDCPRALTCEEKDKAKETGLPICQYTNKPECFKEIK